MDEDERRLEVTRRAHALWEAEGCPEGRSEDHWRQAEAELAAVLAWADAKPTPKPRARGKSHSPR
jgi:DUF2934 family protein